MIQYQLNKQNFRKTIVLFTCAISLMLGSFAMASASQDKKSGEGSTDTHLSANNTISMELKDGVVMIELYPDIAPNHVQRIKELVSEGFYDGLSFHRVIDGFVVQTGDPTGTGAGGSNKPNLNAEFNKMSHTRGMLSMARTDDVNSANSQFFIVLEDAKYLDNKYTVFGKVISGMEYVDKIKKGDPTIGGVVKSPDKIIKMSIVESGQLEPIHSIITQQETMPDSPEDKKVPVNNLSEADSSIKSSDMQNEINSPKE